MQPLLAGGNLPQCRYHDRSQPRAASSPWGGPWRQGARDRWPGDDVHHHRRPPIRDRTRPQQMPPGPVPGQGPGHGHSPAQLRVAQAVAHPLRVHQLWPKLQSSVLHLCESILNYCDFICIWSYFSRTRVKRRKVTQLCQPVHCACPGLSSFHTSLCKYTYSHSSLSWSIIPSHGAIYTSFRLKNLLLMAWIYFTSYPKRKYFLGLPCHWQPCFKSKVIKG